MTRVVRISFFALISLSMIHCAGPSGRRIIGGQGYATDPNQFRNFLNGFPVAPKITVAAPTQENVNKTILPTDIIEYSMPNWIDLCKEYTSADTDLDGLTDDCETALRNSGSIEYGALDPYVYNGVLVGGRYFDPENTKLQLTEAETKEWEKDQKKLGGNGFGSITKESKSVIRKFSALKKRKDPDIYAFKDLFYNYSDEEMRVDHRFASYVRNPNLFQNAGDDQYIALAHGDGSEAVPFSPLTPGNSVYYLTAMADDTDSIRAKNTIMEAIEFHVALPKNVDELQITIGSMSIKNENQVVGSRSGIFYVMNDGESILLQNDLLSDKGAPFEGSRYGTIHRSVSSCTTAHVVIVYFADAAAGSKRTQLFAENVFYRLNEKDSWKNFTQGMLSIQPQGGAGCNQMFTMGDPGHQNMFFKTVNPIASRVQGAVDFNTSLNPGHSNPDYVLSNDPSDSGSVGNVLETALSQIPSMDDARLDEFKKSFSQIDPSGLSEEEKELFAKVVKALDERDGGISPAAVDQSKNTNVVQLDPAGQAQLTLDDMKKLADLGFTFQEGQNKYDPSTETDPNAIKKLTPEELDRILGEMDKKLDSGSLTPEEKQNMLGLLNGLKDNPGVDPAKIDQFLKDHAGDFSAPVQDQNVFQLDPLGKAQLTLDDMKKLAGLGFTFQEGQNKYDPSTETDPNAIKKLTPEELDRILGEMGKKLDSGTLTPAQKQDMLHLLNGLKDNPGVDPAKIDQFLKDHADDLLSWTPEQLSLLDQLNKDLGLGVDDKTFDTWEDGFADQNEKDTAQADVLGKIESKLTDPGNPDFTTEERKAIVDQLKEKGLIDDAKAQELTSKIDGRNAFVDKQGVPHPEFSGFITRISFTTVGGKTFSAYKLDLKINFASGKATLDTNAKNAIDMFGKFVNIVAQADRIKEKFFKVDAYTDAVGSEKTNKTLSEKRAASVKTYLVSLGNPDANITSEGKGIDPNAKRNAKGVGIKDDSARRVEILFGSESFK